MMQRRILAGLAGVLVGAADGGAQGGPVDPQCGTATASARATQDACQKALDLFAFLAPQLGVAIVGGNAALGEHSALGGLGRVSLGLRANVVDARMPRVGDEVPAITGAVQSQYQMRRQVLPLPALDAAIGLFRGIPVSGSYALAVDALVNVAYVPSVDADDVSIDVPGGAVRLGFGGRVALLQETFMTPGISISYLRRDLPSVDVTALVATDELRVRDIRVRTGAWRAVVGKNFSVLGVTLGAGRDTYETSAAAQVTVTRGGLSFTTGDVRASQDRTRDNVFANVALNLAALRVVGEVGRVRGGSTVPTFNAFAGHAAGDAQNYASLGLRVNW